MARYEVALNISYHPNVIIEADSLEEAENLVDDMDPGDLWSMSIDQGDEPWGSDIEIDYVQEAR